MLNTDIKVKMFTTPCIKDFTYLTIVRPIEGGNGALRCVITYLTDGEEHLLNAGETITIKRKSLTNDEHDVYFVVDPNNCFGYGDLKFDNSNNDLKNIEELDWFRRYYYRIYMPTEYDYNSHTVTSDIKGGRYYDTTNPKVFLPYMHGCLNKPEKVVIFREYLDPIYIQKLKERERKKRERKKKQKLKSIDKINTANKIKFSKLTVNIK